MKKAPLPWVMLPSRWIDDGGLKKFGWVRGAGPKNTAALMLLMVIAHHVEKHSGQTELTYDELETKTTLSRSMIAQGLSVLEANNLIERRSENKRGLYQLVHYDPTEGWAKFPAKALYNTNGNVWAFEDFHLRKQAELDALKLYFLFSARRDRETNLAKISYEKISDYSGVSKNGIKRALSLLAVQGLVHVERLPSKLSALGVVNAYRIAHLEPRRHMGTTGRSDLVDQSDFLVGA